MVIKVLDLATLPINIICIWVKISLMYCIYIEVEWVSETIHSMEDIRLQQVVWTPNQSKNHQSSDKSGLYFLSQKICQPIRMHLGCIHQAVIKSLSIYQMQQCFLLHLSHFNISTSQESILRIYQHVIHAQQYFSQDNILPIIILLPTKTKHIYI